MAAFADDGTAGGKVRLGQREIVTWRVTGNAHHLASSRIVPRSGRKINPTLPVSPCRFFATVSSTARAGGVARRSWASVRNTTTSAAYSRSPLSLSESSAALLLPFTTWKVSCNLLNLRKQFAEGFFRAIFISP